ISKVVEVKSFFAKAYAKTAESISKMVSSFNIINVMQNHNVNISMWYALSIPGQQDLLSHELAKQQISSKISEKEVQKTNMVLGTLDQDRPKGVIWMVQNVLNAHDIKKPPPFYLSLILRENLVHNCMVDSGASSTVMPKSIAEKLGLQYEPIEKS
ncbi:hypothetical protein KI387_024671, partial [Taxus chinensis]